MSGPNDTDDGWAELARELGLEQPATPSHTPPPLPPAEPAATRSRDREDGFERPDPSYPSLFVDDAESSGFADDLDSSDEEDGEDTEVIEEAATPTGEGALDENGEPKKKRRRRRRRRGKKVDEAGNPLPAAAPAPVQTEGEYDEDEPAAEVEYESVDTDMEESPSPEAARELIANWDVPSWETIVTTMLHRPGGR